MQGPGAHCIHCACSVAVFQRATARSMGSRSCAKGIRRVVADAGGGRPAIAFSSADARRLRRLSSRVVTLHSERSFRRVFAQAARAHVTSRSVMDSPSEPGAAPHDAPRATILAAHKAMLRRARIDGGDDAGPAGGDDAGPAGGDDEATERPHVMAEADTERVLAENGGGDLEAVESVSVAAAVAAAHQVLVQEDAGAVRVASDKASYNDGREPGALSRAWPSTRPVRSRASPPRVAALSAARTSRSEARRPRTRPAPESRPRPRLKCRAPSSKVAR